MTERLKGLRGEKSESVASSPSSSTSPSSSLRTVTKNSRRPILQNSGTFVVIVFSLFRLNGLSEFSKMGDDNNEKRTSKICFKFPAKKIASAASAF